MTDITTETATDWPVVGTEAGPVTLAPLDALSSRATQLQNWATQAASSAVKLHDQAAERFAASGAILVPRSEEWTVPAALRVSVDQAKALVARISDNDRGVDDLKQSQSQRGIFGRVGAWRKGLAMKRDRVAESNELRSLLIEIAKAAPAPNVQDAEAEFRTGQDLEAQAKTLEQQVQAARASAQQLSQEVGQRTEAVRAMGFDALYEAAALQTSGPQAVDSPLVLKAGERAYLSRPATLARYATKTHYVGGSSGFSFPIGHTGIRYRVGASAVKRSSSRP